MIPRRIALKGFLCYRDEQVIDFDGSDLWVLSGRNGSGKSAVFDALTFALFGAHRGGQRSAARLINADSSGFEVVFDFELNGDRYRIKRSLHRSDNSAKRLISRLEIDEWGKVRCRPVPETDAKAGFEGWVREHLGLTYETFTSSVLLVQGQAEKLLGSDHKERYSVLAGVEDLARFERLAQAADARKGEMKALANAYRAQLDALPPVDEVAFEEAALRATESEAAREAAEAALGRLTELGRRAREWTELNDQRAGPLREAAEARALLADAEEIGRDWNRLRDLDLVVPALRDALQRRTSLVEMDAAMGRLGMERARLLRELDLTDVLKADMGSHRDALVEEHARDETRRREVIERLGVLSVPLERARLAREGRETADRIDAELASDPVDHDAEVDRLEAEHLRRSDWRAVLSKLEDLARDRDGLAAAREQARVARTALNAAEHETAEHEATSRALVSEVALARESAETARDRLTRLRAHSERADAALVRFLSLDGASACDRCGQPLTPSHFAAESARLHSEQLESRRLSEEADLAHRAAVSSRHVMEETEREAAARVQEAREAAQNHRHRLDLAEVDASRCAAACVRAYETLPGPFRIRVSAALPEDWRATAFPTPADLDDARLLVAGIGAVAEQRDAARRRRDDRRAMIIRRDEARRAAAGLGGDEAAEEVLAAEQAALKSERDSLDRCIRGHDVALALAEETLDHLGERCRDLRVRLAEIERDLSAETARAGGIRAELERVRVGMPDPWRGSIDAATAIDIDGWEAERRSLRGRGVEERAGELPRAAFCLQAAQSRLTDLGRFIDTIPDGARRDPAEFADLVAEAKERLNTARAAWEEARDSREQLGRDLKHRRTLEASALAAEREQSIFETLSWLLGWNGLLRHRLREAERAILAGANRFLRVISGGDLELQLVEQGDSQRALNMEVKVRTHGGTRIVEPVYLSGSQKFRVAVSLALGIGQHARGAGRPIESVIIDEGFGCLDLQGRREMIQQLGDLQGILARIILVSHQEEVADAFPDGYRFEIIDGATVAQPFHR